MDWKELTEYYKNHPLAKKTIMAVAPRGTTSIMSNSSNGIYPSPMNSMFKKPVDDESYDALLDMKK